MITVIFSSLSQTESEMNVCYECCASHMMKMIKKKQDYHKKQKKKKKKMKVTECEGIKMYYIIILNMFVIWECKL